MPRFTILPKEQQSVPVPDVFDAGAVLHIVQRLGCKEADVLRDDKYSFSLALGENGIWSILRSDPKDQQTAAIRDVQAGAQPESMKPQSVGAA